MFLKHSFDLKKLVKTQYHWYEYVDLNRGYHLEFPGLIETAPKQNTTTIQVLHNRHQLSPSKTWQPPRAVLCSAVLRESLTIQSLNSTRSELLTEILISSSLFAKHSDLVSTWRASKSAPLRMTKDMDGLKL